MFGLKGLRADLNSLRDAFEAYREGRYFSFRPHTDGRWWFFEGNIPELNCPPIEERLRIIEDAMGIKYERACEKVGPWKRAAQTK